MKSFDHQVFGEMHQPALALNEEGTLHKQETKDSPHKPCNVESVQSTRNTGSRVLETPENLNMEQPLQKVTTSEDIIQQPPNFINLK